MRKDKFLHTLVPFYFIRASRKRVQISIWSSDRNKASVARHDLPAGSSCCRGPPCVTPACVAGYRSSSSLGCGETVTVYLPPVGATAGLLVESAFSFSARLLWLLGSAAQMEILIQHLATVAQMRAVYPCFWVTLPSPDAERASSCNWLILEVRTRVWRDC